MANSRRSGPGEGGAARTGDGPACGVRLSAAARGVLLPVRVVPRAKQSALEGVLDGELKLRIASPPVDGKANAECVAFVAGLLGLRKSAVEVVRGETARRKTLLLKGVSVDHVRAALAGKLPAG